MRQPIQLDPFQAVGAGQRAFLNVSPGYRYHNLCLNFSSNQALGTATVMDSATIQSAITKIELLIANKVQRVYTAEELIMQRQYLGETYRANFLHIPFSEKERRTMFGEESLAWGTGGLKDPAFQCRVTLAAATSTYNNSPSLIGFAERDNIVGEDGLPLPIGSIVKTYETVLTPTGSGWYPWSPDISRGDKIRRVHLKDSGHCTAVQVYANGTLEYDATAAYNTERLTQYGFTPQSNWFHVGHDVDHQVLSNMDTVRAGHLLNSLVYKFNFNASGSYTAFVEVIGPPD
jgi:hypothetical protein